jgi:NAD(P)-dependent dehydrogenase (short-subunit alcohol dehydrogenase family)
MADITGKVVIVTGAGRGLGRGMAITYGRAGAKVVVSSRSKSTVDSVVTTINRDGGTAIGITCDVGVRDQVYDLINQTVMTFGALDILVNNAQSFGTAAKSSPTINQQPLESYDEEEWDHIYRTGLLGTLWGMKAAFPHMRNRGGKIINFGSASGHVGLEGFGAYNAVKEGVRALTRTAAREWGKYHINVNVVVPVVRTDGMDEYERLHPDRLETQRLQIPLRRYGDPISDMGPLGVFLASSDSDYITGMTFMLDGGLFMKP